MLEYSITAATTGPARAVARCKEAEIALDTDPAGRVDAFNPAEMFLGALAACMLKGVERAIPRLKFSLRGAEVRVHGVRQDSPPRMLRVDYELLVDTDESDARLDLLHRNVRDFGTISNTVAAALELSGTVRRAGGAPLEAAPTAAPSTASPAPGAEVPSVAPGADLHASHAVPPADLPPATAFDVVFLGGGPAGYVGAIRCAQLGLSTAVVEREGLGGTCVLWGCIPAKALLESARIANRMRQVAEFGVSVGDVQLDYGVAMRRSRAVAVQNSRGVEFLFKKNGIAWIRGTGRLSGTNAITVRSATGAEQTYEAQKARVVSTGSRIRGLPHLGLALDGTVVLSSDDVLLLEQAPKSMIIVGAGAVGCEFADVFNAFGTQVTLVEVAPRVLPLEDEDSSKEIERAFRKRKIDVLTGATISGVRIGEGSVVMAVTVGGETRELAAEKVLIAAGRAANVEDIGLESADVQLTDRGFVRVNERFETSAQGVYAVGDVVGGPMLAHKGFREGHVLADLLGGQDVHPINYKNIPSCTYCYPEVASTGLTEAQCREQKLVYTVGKFPFAANGRARTTGETEGFVKIIQDPTYGEIRGAHIVGPHASELISELVVVRENEFIVESIDIAIHPHPTLSEAVAEAVLDSMGKMLHA